MKTEIKIKKINDPDTDVLVNSGEHRIDEIKREIAECAAEPKASLWGQQMVKAEVIEMFDESPPGNEPDE